MRDTCSWMTNQSLRHMGRKEKGKDKEEKGMRENGLKSGKEAYGSPNRSFSSLSIWALLARSSIYKISAALIMVTAAQWALFSGMLRHAESLGGRESLDRMLNVAAWPGFLISLGTAYCILALTQGRMDDRSSCTLMRLRLDRTAIFGIRTAYNVFCLTAVFAVQAALAVAMVRLYGQAAGREGVLAQTMFLTFYRNRFLHCLLPLAETGKWVRNGLVVLALGMEAAGGTGKKRAVMQTVLFAAVASWFVSYIGMNVLDGLCDVLCGICIVVDLYRAGVFRTICQSVTDRCR